jgi:hypothetical protein
MAYKLQTERGKAIYAARKFTVEPVIGIIKEVLGFRQFSLRGLQAGAGEWCLVCLAFNPSAALRAGSETTASADRPASVAPGGVR